MRRRRGLAVPIAAVIVTFLLASLLGGFCGRLMFTALAASLVALAVGVVVALVAHSRRSSPQPPVTFESGK